MLANHDAHYVHAVWLIASLFGVAAIIVLAVLYRRAARSHELERAQQIIDDYERDPHA